ncbi:MAG: hypothetical protein ACRBN8_41770 [Nannocystales bacterium]
MTAACFLALALLSLAPSSNEGVATDDTLGRTANTTERWTVGGGVAVGPLEPFPRLGLSLVAHYRWRWLRIGAHLAHYPGATQGNVTRSATLIEPHAQFFVIDSRWVDWSFDVGIGLAVFHDDYLQVYDDVSRLAPGFSLGTSLEIRASRVLRPYVGVQTHSYFTPDIADDKWVEITAGLRLSF